MKVLMAILAYIWLSLHSIAGIMNTIFDFVIVDAVRTGPVLWAVPGVCLVLAVLDLTGRVRLSGTLGKLAAAFALPALCGAIDVLLRDWVVDPTPPVCGCFLSLLALAVYVLLWEAWAEEPLARATALVEQGSCLTVAVIGWLQLLGVLIFLVTVFGALLVIIIGGLMASKNSLLDYPGVLGWLLGMLLLHLFQSMLFWKGARLARKADPALDSGVPLLTLFLPVWNLMQASKLETRLKLWGAKDFY